MHTVKQATQLAAPIVNQIFKGHCVRPCAFNARSRYLRTKRVPVPDQIHTLITIRYRRSIHSPIAPERCIQISAKLWRVRRPGVT